MWAEEVMEEKGKVMSSPPHTTTAEEYLSKAANAGLAGD